MKWRALMLRVLHGNEAGVRWGFWFVCNQPGPGSAMWVVLGFASCIVQLTRDFSPQHCTVGWGGGCGVWGVHTQTSKHQKARKSRVWNVDALFLTNFFVWVWIASLKGNAFCYPHFTICQLCPKFVLNLWNLTIYTPIFSFCLYGFLCFFFLSNFLFNLLSLQHIKTSCFCFSSIQVLWILYAWKTTQVRKINLMHQLMIDLPLVIPCVVAALRYNPWIWLRRENKSIHLYFCVGHALRDWPFFIIK